MAASSNRQVLTNVASQIGDVSLAPRGFKRLGTTFRRQLEPGFIHIVDFQLGPSWSITSGHFTVEVCVYIQEAFELFFLAKPPRRPRAIDCELRQQLGMLDDPSRDQWWPLTTAPETLASRVGELIERRALPFLGRLTDRCAIVEAWRSQGSMALGLPPRGDLLVAMLLRQLGQHDAADKILDAELTESKGKVTEPFVTRIATRLRAEATA